MPLNARRFVRKMRGGAQAHLMECDDGRFYVVKFTNNPQHRRILINETIASTFLGHLEIAAPATSIIELTPEFITNNPEAHIQLGSQRTPPEPGWHFGSQYPGDPDKVAIYDFVPDTLIGQAHNIRDFVGVFVLDKWLCNADGRQCVYFRAKLKEWTPASTMHPLKQGFLALMIDHGFAFNGPHWEFPDSPLQGLYHRRLVYDGVTSIDSFQPWLSRVVHFPESVVDDAYKKIPPQWLDQDRDALEGLLETLMRRRRRLEDLIRQTAASTGNPFTNLAL